MSKFRKSLVENKGFTLIELLVVIAILGILAAIAVPRLAGFTDRAKKANLEAGGQAIRSNVELHIAEHGSLPDLSTTINDASSDYYVSIDEGYGLNDTASGSGINSYSYELYGDGYKVNITEDGVEEPTASS